jgi:hypothetical protein
MTQKSGNIILVKDLHNDKASNARAKTGKVKESDIEELQRVINDKIKQDGGVNNFHYIQSEDQKEIYGAFYQNDSMRDIFQTYGTQLFIDSTFKLNKNDYPVIVFVVSDHNRESRIVGFALVAFERQIIIDSVFDFFIKLNKTEILRAVMIDKDLKEDSAIATAFPQARVLYCFWHVRNTFAKK